MDPYEDSDQSERLKKWWKTYGNALILGIALGGSTLAGVKYWQHHLETQAHTASVHYEQLLEHLARRNMTSVEDIGAKLIKDFDGTPYAGKAALILAKQKFENKDSNAARQHLEWAMKNAAEPAVRQVARLRLARLMIDQGKFEAAAELASIKDKAGFEADYAEIYGDAMAALGRVDQARTAYRAAIENLPKDSPYQLVLTMKLDDLGVEKKP